MITGGAAWSLLADTVSRKWTLVLALVVLGISTAGLTFSSTFLLFGLFRGLGAFSLSGVRCMTVTFISEFQIRHYRGCMICCLQLAWVIGMVGIPVLPFSWKSLILIGVIPIIFAIVGLTFFPDSPRFLLSRGRDKAAVRSLQMIHAINTGTKKITFPIRRLVDNKTVAEIRSISVVKSFIPSYMEPKFICIPVVMLTQFVLMFSYYTLAMWFPYMLAREEAFFPVVRVRNIPQDCRAGIYYEKSGVYDSVLSETGFFGAKYIDNDTLVISPLERKLPEPENPCALTKKVRFDTGSSNVMDALACMPSLIWLVVKIDTMGRKFFLTFAHIIAGCLAFASYFMHNVGMELLFSCLFDSVALLSVAVSHCLAVELFPTRVRVLGVALVEGSAQLGAILADIGGAISFGLTCVVIVALIAIAMAISGILTITLPDTRGIALR
ncbi:hypothetical protein ILUMI_25096 [Ignelater luminosus]|uniref:Major facilitator superfamily (MFS) profile domain-containing protein n=1 Tax=Ignelater luminosus TaxID=2038154 RepID=A0A8K0C587_IGNLU|nr:hypothetical protein ILUMI_25096 [Ignelater luminosus]